MVSVIPARVLNQAVNCASMVTRKNFAISVIFPLVKPRIPLKATAKAANWQPRVKLYKCDDPRSIRFVPNVATRKKGTRNLMILWDTRKYAKKP